MQEFIWEQFKSLSGTSEAHAFIWLPHLSWACCCVWTLLSLKHWSIDISKSLLFGSVLLRHFCWQELSFCPHLARHWYESQHFNPSILSTHFPDKHSLFASLQSASVEHSGLKTQFPFLHSYPSIQSSSLLHDALGETRSWPVHFFTIPLIQSLYIGT